MQFRPPLSFAEKEYSSRRAFTLIELLVVITIVLLLTAVTIVSVNLSYSADRMRAGARQIQSLLLGARDKAIYAKEVRGIRLLLDPNDNHCVSAVQYIGAPERETGTLTFNPGPTFTNDVTGRAVVQLGGTQWLSLYRRGFLRTGARIEIPRGSGGWYVISAINTNTGLLLLNRPCRDLAGTTAIVDFAIELSSGILGDAEPVQLPRGVVIDLDGSNVPRVWRPLSLTAGYSPQMDILFTPRGTIVGDSSSLGAIHLHIADATDVLKWKGIAGRSQGSFFVNSLPLVPADNASPAAPVVTRDRVLVSLATRTGNASVHYVNPANSNNLSLADDPFLFAETGRVANK